MVSVRWERVAKLLLMAAGLSGAATQVFGQTDSPWLYGIHWYNDNTSDNDVEAMTGGKGVWSVEHAFVDSNSMVVDPKNDWEAPWRCIPLDKTVPWAKAAFLQGVVGKGHTPIIRLHPNWSVNVPYAGDPYTNSQYADDCKAAANLMKYVHIWQIGNEANLEGENKRWNPVTSKYDHDWPSGTFTSHPEQYAATYVACRDKIHEVIPTTTPGQQVVLMQPCSPGRIDPAPSVKRFIDSNEYLQRMIAAVPDKSKIDGFALHSYAQPGGANFGTDGFMEALREQLMIIDQAGLGDRPVFITEFNKHMPNVSDAPVGAGFITTAYAALNTWNTGVSQVWPGQPNHKIKGTGWFIYKMDAGDWAAYSLRRFKDLIVSTDPAQNPWYAFQQAAGQNYVAGIGVGPVLGTSAQWWTEDFKGTSLDAAGPLPHWLAETGNGGSVALTNSAAGEVRLIGGTNPVGNASIRPPSYAFTNFRMQTDVTFTDANRMATDEANFDLRIREGTNGYSMTFYSSMSAGGAAARAGQVFLRRTNDWNVIYKSAAIPGGINTGDRFRVEVTAAGADLSFRVWRLPSETLVLDWTGANKVTNADHTAGGIRAMVYNMREAQVENFIMGGPTATLLTPSGVEDFALYE